MLDVSKTPLAGVLVLEPRRIGDARGWFCETWHRARLSEHGITTDFVQDNHSFSATPGTLRGLHYQSPPHAQTKLVRCVAGAVWDVSVDARPASPTWGHWFGLELSAENGRQLLIPEGFLHGFVTLRENAEIIYKCSDYYAPDCEGSVAWNSPALGIDWPLPPSGPLLSDKDRAAVDFADWQSPFA